MSRRWLTPIDAGSYGPVERSGWVDVDWREHQRWVRVHGRWANVVELGSGPPIVFVHGLGGRWANWLENLLEFARDHRVIAVDLPGFGDSEMPEEKISISGYAKWLDALCGELGVEAAAVVGNSMGGFVSAELALTAPSRVERLVLVAAAGLSVEDQRNDAGVHALEAGENLLQAQAAFVLSRAEWLVRRPWGRRGLLWFVVEHADELPPELAYEQVKGTGKPGFLPALDALTSYPIRDRIPGIRCPTLIVWGENDKLVPLKDARDFAEAIPDNHVVVYADTGHVPMLERPERFNADLRAFVAGQPADARERFQHADAQQDAQPAAENSERDAA